MTRTGPCSPWRGQLLEPHTREILRKLGGVLNDAEQGEFVHTDATAYASGEKNYSNWESADRANASRRELILGGMNEQKILRVVGLSSVVLFDKDDPTNPVNRRISIIVMSNKATEALGKEGAQTKEIRTNEAVTSRSLGVSDASRPKLTARADPGVGRREAISRYV